MKYKIEKLKKEDILKLNEIQEKYFDMQTREDFEFVLENDNYLFFTASLNNKIIAYAGVSISYERSDLLCVCVEQEYRRQGVARQLLSKLFDSLKQRKVEEILLEVNVNNQKAINLYQTLGFDKIHERKNYYGNDTAVIMRKVL